MADALDEAWGWLVRQLLEWALNTFTSVLLWWMTDSTFSVHLGGEKNGVLYSLRAHTNWLTAVMAFIGFMVAAFRIAVRRKGEPLRAALSQFFTLAVIVLTLATLLNLVNLTGDRYSAWIVEDMMPQDGWEEDWNKGTKILENETDTNFILAFFALAASVSLAIQFMLMLFRSGVLIVLVGIFPVVAASRFSSYGEAAYRRCFQLMVGWALVKPAFATIYAAALGLLDSGHEADRLFGLALLAGAVFVPFTVLRLIAPPTADNNVNFGIRQLGHFVFGGTAQNVGGFVAGLLPLGGPPAPGPPAPLPAPPAPAPPAPAPAPPAPAPAPAPPAPAPPAPNPPLPSHNPPQQTPPPPQPSPPPPPPSPPPFPPTPPPTPPG